MASELWRFRKAPVTIQISSSDDDDDDDVLACLPDSKRRRLLRGRPPPQTINLDSDENEAKGSQKSDDVVAVEPPVTDAGSAEFELPAAKPRRRKSAAADPRVQKLLEENRRAMEELQKAAQDGPDDDPAEADEPGQQEPPEPPPESDAKVLLVCKTQRHGTVKLRLRKGDPMSKLFSAFQLHAERRGWVKEGAEMRFEFDGERLSGKETPASLEAEDDDVIDVVYTTQQ